MTFVQWLTSGVTDRLNRIEAKVDYVISKEIKMALSLDDLKAKADAAKTKMDTIAALVADLKAVVAAGGDPVKIQAIADQLDAIIGEEDTISPPPAPPVP